ncbi:MAG: hypothetical protein QOD63_2207 [Actinomycetota bacterium]|jgi:hypothetical protein|nr:hypothetical protein [Actinomycetota bacterium]
MTTPAPFFRRGVTKVYAVPTITLAAPTAVQVNAGTHLSTPNNLADVQGFSYTNQPIAVPDLSDNYDGKIVGVDQSADGQLHFYHLKGTSPNPLLATLAKGVVINITIFWLGLAGATPAAGDVCDVFPCSSSGPAKDMSMTEAAKWHVTVPSSSRPTQDIALV